MADCPSAFVSSDVSSDGIEVGVSDLLKLCRVKDPDTQKRRIDISAATGRFGLSGFGNPYTKGRGMNEHPPGQIQEKAARGSLLSDEHITSLFESYFIKFGNLTTYYGQVSNCSRNNLFCTTLQCTRDCGSSISIRECRNKYGSSFSSLQFNRCVT